MCTAAADERRWEDDAFGAREEDWARPAVDGAVVEEDEVEGAQREECILAVRAGE